VSQHVVPAPTRMRSEFQRPTTQFGVRSVAVAAALASMLVTGNVQALTLGRLTVLSKLGEPLLAEIDVPRLSEAEATSLQLGTASPDAYRAAGADFNTALIGAEIQLVRRADGRPVLRVQGTRGVSEPYVDLIVEANWSSGRIVRDYTMLFDPPDVRRPPAPPPLAISPTTSAAATMAPAADTPETESLTSLSIGSMTAPAVNRTTDSKPASAKNPANTFAGKTKPSQAGQILVKGGDTASQIANRQKPEGITLDQMLVAMLRDNPNAFIRGNVNRIKAGSIVQLADAQSASNTSAEDARQIIQAQSRDFGSYRRRLATAVTEIPAQTKPSLRKASGKIQTEVTEPKNSPITPDQLKLSKGIAASKDQASKEDALAQARKADADAAREAELTKNLAELNKIAQTTETAVEPLPATSEPQPEAVQTPALPLAKPILPAEPSSAPAAQPTPTSAENPTEDASLIDAMAEHPATLPAAGLLIAGLLGFASYRWRQQQKHTPVDSSYLESRLQPDSFFGSSGGQNIDTDEAVATGSSMMYSPSQLDAGGDVDPVAEADVYLAYGRDLQAEEILKEALRLNPARVAIHMKLLEIYAKRRDPKAFEAIASEMYGLTGGVGDDWRAVCASGQELDPSNPLYQPGGQPVVVSEINEDILTREARPFQAAPPTSPSNTIAPSQDSPVDLDFDFSTGKDQVFENSTAQESDLTSNEPDAELLDLSIPSQFSNSPSLPPPVFELNASDLSFDSSMPASSAAPPEAPFPPEVMSDEMALDFDLPFQTSTPSLAAESEPSGHLNALAHEESSSTSDISMAFDGSEMQPNAVTDPISLLEDIPEGDPLETKLSLAAEFMAIGDMEGARSLAEEVEEQATGRLKDKAKAFLADLG